MRAMAVAVTAVLAMSAPAAPAQQLKIAGTQFVDGRGKPFAWRGITAFRLVEFVAHGRERDADAYLRWAASQTLTIVRVFAMADGIFQLTPAEGERALPRLLRLP